MMKNLTLACLLVAGFMGANAQTVTNGTMEAWHTYNVGFVNPATLSAPNGWHGSDSLVFVYGPLLLPGATFHRQIFKSTDAHGGTYAARIESRDQDTAIFPGALTNANIQLNLSDGSFTYSGGQAVTQRIDTVSAWIKYYPVTGTLDEGFMQADAVMAGAGAGGSDSVVGTSGMIYIDAMSAYSLIDAPIMYNNGSDVPDHIRITFSSSSGVTTAEDSSVMLVDDVTMKAGSTAVAKLDFENTVVKLFPNPAANTLQLSTTLPATLYFEAYNAQGQKIAGQDFQQQAVINTTALAQGWYSYKLSDKAGQPVQQGSFLIQRR